MNNHRYQGLSEEEIQAIKKKEAEASDKEICRVIHFFQPDKVEALARADERPGLMATKKARAAREIFLRMDSEGQKEVRDRAIQWQTTGYPPTLQDRLVDYASIHWHSDLTFDLDSVRKGA